MAGAMRAIECEAARMAQLIDDLLLLARLDEERPLRVEPCSLDEVVQAAVEAARVVDAAHPVTCVLERSLIIAGDAAAMRRVADNLLGNARRHTPPRTGISVGLARVGDQAVLTVADTGPGIPVPDRDRLFERFFRPGGGRSRDRGGAGLGLAIVHAIVTAHHGQVSVTDAYPHGAVFEVRLPVPADGAGGRF